MILLIYDQIKQNNSIGMEWNGLPTLTYLLNLENINKHHIFPYFLLYIMYHVVQLNSGVVYALNLKFFDLK